MRLLRALGYEGLLMLPLVLQGGVWALVEVYRRAGGFSDQEAVAGALLLNEAVGEAAA